MCRTQGAKSIAFYDPALRARGALLLIIGCHFIRCAVVASPVVSDYLLQLARSRLLAKLYARTQPAKRARSRSLVVLPLNSRKLMRRTAINDEALTNDHH